VNYTLDGANVNKDNSGLRTKSLKKNILSLENLAAG
jgi:hypothetical protein